EKSKRVYAEQRRVLSADKARGDGHDLPYSQWMDNTKANTIAWGNSAPSGTPEPQNHTKKERTIMDQALLATVTGEKFQPVRLHYQVFDSAGLARSMKKLRCLDYVVAQKRWVWLYDHEAKELPFERSWAELTKQFGHPVVIGSFFPRARDK